MKQIKYLSLIFSLILSNTCSETHEEITQQEEAQYLQELFDEIQNMAKSVTCEDASIWQFTSYGSKACGGPIGYIAYANTIDTQLFLEKVATHKAAENAYNQKWGIASDCMIAAEPTDVTCENGEAVLIYSHTSP